MVADVGPALWAYDSVRGSEWFGQNTPYILACTSAYPCPGNEAGLARIIRSPADQCRGYSDHTRHPWTGAMAVCVGAKIIEFHVRLEDTDPKNADYAVARYPREAVEYVRNVRTAEKMMGSGASAVMPSEEKNMRYRVGVRR